MTKNEYVLPSSEAESRRLEEQAALYGGVAFLERFLADTPAEVLEVGCGTGYFARYVAERLPGSRVTGVDVDEERLAFARSRACVPNLTFLRGDIAALPFLDGRFDLVFCRFVLVHATSPGADLAEMARVTRPRGQVVAYDMVHAGIWFSPPRPAFEELLRRALTVMREQGMEPDQGLHLAPGMQRAGLVGVQAEVIPYLALGSEAAFDAYRCNWIETIAGLAESLGTHFDPALVERAQRELAREGDDQLILETTVLACGRKSGAAAKKTP